MCGNHNLLVKLEYPDHPLAVGPDDDVGVFHPGDGGHELSALLLGGAPAALQKAAGGVEPRRMIAKRFRQAVNKIAIPWRGGTLLLSK